MRSTFFYSTICGFFLLGLVYFGALYESFNDLQANKDLLDVSGISDLSLMPSLQREKEREREKQAKSSSQNQYSSYSNRPNIESDIVTKKHLGQALQNELKDTVVQVFSQIMEFNWVEPYKTPFQSEATGTAFFISGDGELITNYHVIDQSKTVYIQIPSLGKLRFEVDVIGVSPERDLALLKLKPSELLSVKRNLKRNDLNYLKLGDSDKVARADKIMALGYPLGQQGLKSTTGVVSGREHLGGQYFIQISAPLNKGNSGGPSLNQNKKVTGVNSAIAQGAQGVGYIIPINEVKLFLDQLKNMPNEQDGTPKLLKKPFLGVHFNNANDNLTEFLQNPQPGGLYVVEVYKGSPLSKVGIQAGDMLYKINGLPIDIYGEMNVPWNKEDKISIVDYISRLNIGDKVDIEYYRKGDKKRALFKFAQTERPPIRRMYPGYEKIDYEVLAGLVIMPLTLNHVILLAQVAPELVQYADFKKHMEPALVITNVMISSPASRTRCIAPGAIISEINGEKAKTLEECRKALRKSSDIGFLTIKTSENIFLVIPLKDIIENESKLSLTYFYPISKIFQELEQKYKSKKSKIINNILG